MTFRAVSFACLPVLLASAHAADAAIFVLTGNLSGANEVPAVASPGTGSATVTYDDATKMLSVQLTFSGLLGTTAASHIHCCAAAGVNTTVATTVPSFSGFPLGVTAGSFSGMFDLTQSGSYNPAFVSANGGTVDSARAALVAGLLGGQTYLNIHTSLFPSGEIRTQLTAVPEPASWSMMIAGFALAGGALRRSRRATGSGDHTALAPRTAG